MQKNNMGKTALVLAGGGITGAFYEIGALRAIDDLLVDRTVNDFDIYIGTSSGALISAFLANGMSPERMFEILNGSDEMVESISQQEIFYLNLWGYLRNGINIPIKFLHAWSQYLRNFNQMTLIDLIWSLSDILPAGLYDTTKISDFVSATMDRLNLSNDFNQLSHALYIIATDLDTGDRAVFGSNQIETSISLATAASSALPVIYKPVCINNNEYIDGGLRGIASIDLAIEKGATLVVCINPLVPFNNELGKNNQQNEKGEEHLSDKGLTSIVNQTLRIFTHAGLHYHIKQLKRTYPNVEFILIEPQRDDYQMFYSNVMQYSTRLSISRHGFESVTYDLANDYQKYKEVLTHHNIPITRRLVIEELAEIQSSHQDPRVISRIIEAKQPGCSRYQQGAPVCELTKALARLEMKLDQITS